MTIPLVLLAVFAAEVERAGAGEFAPLLHAQVTVESAWRPDARSRWAAGLAQFTPPTWGDIAPLTDPPCDGAAETDPACSIRAQIVYMVRLLRRYGDSDRRARWAFAQAAYNGGAGWISREKKVCARRLGCDPAGWFDHVERHCVRAGWACEENRAYPRKIVRALPEGP